MKLSTVLLVLCFFSPYLNLSNAQNNSAIQNTPKKKYTITQDLNKLELQKINAVSVNKSDQIDTLKQASKSDSIKIISKEKTKTIVKPITKKVDSIQKIDTIKQALKSDSLKIIAKEKTKTIVKPITKKADSSQLKDNIKQASKSDSIKIISKEKTKTIVKPITKKADSIQKIDSLKQALKSDSIKVVSKQIIKDSTSILNFIDTISEIKNQIIISEKDSVCDITTIKKNVVFEKLSSKDSILKASYNKQASFADSIRNANKYWLDSTLSALPKSKPVVINKDDEIEIFVSGGGFYAGVNPRIYDRLTIYHSGLVHREYKTKLQGEQLEEKILSKDELKKLAQYIVDMGFFNFDNIYDCNKADAECKKRIISKPEPIPLSISVRIGERKLKTYVTLYAPRMESNWVNYPKTLEKILDAIYEVASK